MIVNEVYPGSNSRDIDPGASTFEEVADWYPPITGLRINYLISATGTTYATSHDITNSIDRYFLKAIRAVSDLIITTGKTARAENLSASRFAPIAILTNSPDELQIPATQIDSQLPVLIASQNKLSINYQNTAVMFLHLNSNETAPSVQEIIDHLASSKTLVETGLIVSADLVRFGMIQEICLTVVAAKSLEQAQVAAEAYKQSLVAICEQVQILRAETTYFFRFQIVPRTV